MDDRDTETNGINAHLNKVWLPLAKVLLIYCHNKGKDTRTTITSDRWRPIKLGEFIIKTPDRLWLYNEGIDDGIKFEIYYQKKFILRLVTSSGIQDVNPGEIVMNLDKNGNLNKDYFCFNEVYSRQIEELYTLLKEENDNKSKDYQYKLDTERGMQSMQNLSFPEKKAIIRTIELLEINNDNTIELNSNILRLL